jgi:hypothetical protein
MKGAFLNVVKVACKGDASFTGQKIYVIQKRRLFHRPDQSHSERRLLVSTEFH